MALIVADRVQETTNSTGTGAYTLGGAVAGFQAFSAEVSNADTVYYSVTDNDNFEVGLGTYASSGGTITRTAVFTSSNSNNAVNWGIGTKNIFLTYPADKAVLEDASNNVTIGNNLVVGGTVDGRDVAADGTKLDYISVTQAVDLDQMETDIAALANGMVYKGDWNASAGSFPGGGSAQTGWFYYVSVAGTVNSISFAVGDNIVATTDNASASTYANNWSKHDQTDAVQAVVGLTGSVSKSALLSALNVEDGADVTDTANVTSAGALMDSELTNLAAVKAINQSLVTTASPTFAGLATTANVTFGDNDKAIFGAGSDLQIYHDGSRSIIQDSGTGNLRIQAANLELNSWDNAENYIFCQDNGAVTLYYDNAAKLATTSTGIAVTGNVTVSGTVDGRDVATDGTKLDGIEASADVTDTANVTSAGALMDSEVTNLAQVKAFDSSDYATAAQGTTANAALPKAGGTMTGDVLYNDNIKAKFGAGSDLQIYHDGSNSYVQDAGDGALILNTTNGGGVYVYSAGETMATFNSNGAVNLYYDNAAKLATTSTGISVTGNVTVSGTVDGRDVATDGTKLDGIASGATNVTNNNQLTNGAGYTTNVGDITGVSAGSGLSGGGTSGSVTLSHSDTSSQSSVNNSGATVIQDVTLDTYGHVTGLTSHTMTLGNLGYTGATNANYITNNNQLTNGAGYITSYVNTTYSAGTGLDLSGTTFSIESDLRGEVWYMGRTTSDYIEVENTQITFVLDGAVDMRLYNSGDLHVEGNVVAYSTSISDERLKKDIVKIDNALDKVSQLNGYTFEYIADGKKSAGVIAQEVEKVMPSAITESILPLKMGDDDKTEYKTVQYDQLHGLLIEAIKELKAEIEELKAR